MILCESEPGDIQPNSKTPGAYALYIMSGYWLVKQEPDGPRGYSIDEMKKDGQTIWDGVHNNLALKHMRNMKKGDLALFYHTGKERRAVGMIEVCCMPYPNPEEDDERFVAVDVRYKKHLKRPVGLDEMKKFKGWEMLRISRLSVVPVPEKIWDEIMRMSSVSAPRPRAKS